MDKSQKISVLGSGWLGLPLTQYLSTEAYTVKTSTRSELRAKKIREQGIDVCVFDIEQLNESDLTFLDADILIINITSKNIEAFGNLIGEIEKSSIQNVLFVSSTSVYPNLNKVITEDDQVELKDNKLFKIENAFQENKNFTTTILRFSGLIGYSRHPGNWFSSRPISQPNAPVNLIHRDDCIGIINAIISQSAWGVVFNACADTHPIKKEFYFNARRLLNKKRPEVVSEEVLEYKIISNAKLKKALNYAFIYPNLMDIRFEN